MFYRRWCYKEINAQTLVNLLADDTTNVKNNSNQLEPLHDRIQVSRGKKIAVCYNLEALSLHSKNCAHEKF